MDIETLKIVKEMGAGFVSLLACFWLLRELVLKMGVSLNALAENLKLLSANILSLQSRIEFWNKDSEVAHSAQRLELKQILDNLQKGSI